jgi:hypothetical protein
LIFQREQQKKNESLSIKSIKPENFGWARISFHICGINIKWGNQIFAKVEQIFI